MRAPATMKMIVASSCSSLQLRQNVVKPCRASLRPLVVRAAVRKDKPAVEPVTGRWRWGSFVVAFLVSAGKLGC